MKIKVEFKSILFKFDPRDLHLQYDRVKQMVACGKLSWLDAAECCRKLRDAAYAIVEPTEVTFVEACAARNDTKVRQIMVVDGRKNEALIEACRQFRELFPSPWVISARVASYESWQKFTSAVKMHETCKTWEKE